jgi:hypothetical protein
MLSTTQNHQNTIAIRNYCIALGSVILLSTSLADLYHQPSRAAQQDKLDNFGRFVSAGLVSKAINH